ncbi:MAG: AAA family ATPase [Eubacteriales bacterium]|nr:AAA family ATPase [Eubacteriales bacterium]
MIKGIHFKNYSVLRDFTLGLTREDLESSNSDAASISLLLGLIGKNSSGKSTVFDGLAYLRDIVKFGLSRASSMDRRGGFASLKSKGPDRKDEKVELEVIGETPDDEHYSYRLVLADDTYQRPYIYEEKLECWPQGSQQAICHFRQQAISGGGSQLEFLDPQGEKRRLTLADAKEPGLAFLGRVDELPFVSYIYRSFYRIFVYRISPEQTLPAKKEAGGHSRLRDRGDNLENVLAFLRQKDPQAYDAWLADSLGKIYGEQMSADQFKLEEMSTGERKFFELLLVLKESYSLICLDEPDVSLYYKMVESLLVEMRDYGLKSPDSQIIFSTHNSSLLQGLKPEEVWIMDRSRKDDSISARPASEDPIVRSMYEEGLDMGMLWYGGYLGNI